MPEKLHLPFHYFVICSILILVRIFRRFLIHLDHFRHVSFFSLQNVLLSLLYENTCTHFICSSFIDSYSFEGCSILHNYFIENFPFFSTVWVLANNIDINNDIDRIARVQYFLSQIQIKASLKSYILSQKKIWYVAREPWKYFCIMIYFICFLSDRSCINTFYAYPLCSKMS